MDKFFLNLVPVAARDEMVEAIRDVQASLRHADTVAHRRPL